MPLAVTALLLLPGLLPATPQHRAESPDPVLPGSWMEVVPWRGVAGQDVPGLRVLLETGDQTTATTECLTLVLASQDGADFAAMEIRVLAAPVSLEIRKEPLNTREIRVLRLLPGAPVPPHSTIVLELLPAPGRRLHLPTTSTPRLLWLARETFPPPLVRNGFLQVPDWGLDVQPSPPLRLNPTLPSLAAPGEVVPLHVAVLDRWGNPAPGYREGAELRLSDGRVLTLDPGSLLPGFVRIDLSAPASDVLRVVVTAGDLLPGESNPLLVLPERVLRGRRLWFGDEQLHSIRSDGSLPLAVYVDRLRRWGTCDWVAFTDHDRPFLHPFDWSETQWRRRFALLDRLQTPRLTLVPAYEWTRAFHDQADPAQEGHRCILAADPATILPPPESTDPGADTFLELVRILDARGGDWLAIPHHLPLYRWWEPPGVDTGLRDARQPVAEVISTTHGNYETTGRWLPVHRVGGGRVHPDLFWRDGLVAGVRAGAVGGSDNHAGFGGLWVRPLGYELDPRELDPDLLTPNLLTRTHRASATAVLAPSNSRQDIVQALQARRCYATSGPRIALWFTVADHLFGEEADWPAHEPVPVSARVATEAPILALQVFRVDPSGCRLVHERNLRGQGRRLATLHFEDEPLGTAPWTAWYLRVRQEGYRIGDFALPEQRAIASPVWLDAVVAPSEPAPRSSSRQTGLVEDRLPGR